MLFLNNSLSTSMLPTTCNVSVTTIALEAFVEEIARAIEGIRFNNTGNPSHAPTWAALASMIRRRALLFDEGEGEEAERWGLAAEGIERPWGGKVALQGGDVLLVAEISGLPRETREFTEEEIARATFRFRRIAVL